MPFLTAYPSLQRLNAHGTRSLTSAIINESCGHKDFKDAAAHRVDEEENNGDHEKEAYSALGTWFMELPQDQPWNAAAVVATNGTDYSGSERRASIKHEGGRRGIVDDLGAK